MGFIYALIDPRNGATRYVGQTNSKNPRHRLYSHRRSLGLSPVKCWNKKLAGLGLKSEMVVLEETTDLDVAECKWMGLYQAAGCNLLNVRNGGVYGSWPQAKGNRGPENLRKGRALQLERRAEKERASLCPSNRHPFPEEMSIQGKRRTLVCRGCRREARPQTLKTPPHKECMVAGCERSFYGVPGERGQRYKDSPGYCAFHYQQWRRSKIRNER